MRNTSAFQPNGLKQIQLADTSLFSDANLQAYWKFDESSGNAADSKNSNTLINSNVTYAAAKFNNGAVFNGTNAIFRVANTLQYSGNFSISGWAKPTDATAAAEQTIIANEVTGTAGGPYKVSIQTSGKLRFSVYATGTGAETYVESASALTDGAWVQFTCVRDGTNIILYLNGVYNNQTAWSTAQITNASNYFQVGATQNSGGTNLRLFTGSMDDIAVFDKALTAGEISQLYFSGTTKAYYPLNGSSTDFSGSGNHGTDTAITYPQGRFGQAAKFNGTTSKIAMGNVLPFERTDTKTFSFWLNHSNTSGSTTVFAKQDNSSPYGGYGMEQNNGRLRYFEINSVAGSNFLSIDFPVGYNDNRWHNIVVTSNGGSNVAGTTLYVDGRAVTKTSVSDTLSSSILNAKAFVIGARDTGANFFAGNIDEFLIESRAWTAKEVETYYRKSMLNYKQNTFAQFLQSISITDTLSLLDVTTGIRSRLATVTDTLGMTESISAIKAMIINITDTLHLSEARTYVRDFIANITDTLGLTENNTFRFKWNNKTKNTSTWTDKVKNSSIWTQKPK